MQIQEHITLAPYTTFRIGGPARYLVLASTTKDVLDALAFAEEKKIPVVILGAGSNVLVSDEGFPGMVMVMKGEKVDVVDEEREVIVIADAGKRWDDLVAESVREGWYGMENLSGIPSSVGASVVQNIGAYGAEASQLVAWVEVYDRSSHEVKRMPASSCAFGYRDSVFKTEAGKDLVVLRVAYRLRKEGSPNITYKDLLRYHETVSPIRTSLDTRRAVLAVREGKFPKPHEAGTAGSFFKNPVVSASVAKRFSESYPDAPLYPESDDTVKLSAAWIIDHVLQMKGVRRGDVGTWHTQALIIVNHDRASAHAVHSFAQEISNRSEQEIGVRLTPEVVMIGNVARAQCVSEEKDR